MRKVISVIISIVIFVLIRIAIQRAGTKAVENSLRNSIREQIDSQEQQPPVRPTRSPEPPPSLPSALPAPACCSLLVTNGSSYDIHNLYMSFSRERNWGPDRLGNAILRSDSAITFDAVPPGIYDMRLIDEDRDECIVTGVTILNNQSLVITNERLMSCQNALR